MNDNGYFYLFCLTPYGRLSSSKLLTLYLARGFVCLFCFVCLFVLFCLFVCFLLFVLFCFVLFCFVLFCLFACLFCFVCLFCLFVLFYNHSLGGYYKSRLEFFFFGIIIFIFS